MSTTAPPGPLKCIACGYPLANLPAWHVCPECGVPYDPYARVHKVNVAARHAMQLVAAVLLGTLAAVAYMPRIAAGEERFDVLLYYWGGLLVLSLGSIYRLLRSIGAPCRVLINHQGIRFERPNAKPLLITWREFSKAHQSFFSGRLNIWDRDGHQLLRRCERNLGGRGWRRSMVAKLNMLAEVYAHELPAVQPVNAPTTE